MGHILAADMGADPFKPLFLTVKRQMVGKFIDQNKRQQSGTSYAAGQK